jgi:hypothetical protein
MKKYVILIMLVKIIKRMVKIKYCLITTYSKFKTCLKKKYKNIKLSCSKLFTRKKYNNLSESIILNQNYDPFPISEDRL